jgi:hypothetical protein
LYVVIRKLGLMTAVGRELTTMTESHQPVAASRYFTNQTIDSPVSINKLTSEKIVFYC